MEIDPPQEEQPVQPEPDVQVDGPTGVQEQLEQAEEPADMVEPSTAPPSKRKRNSKAPDSSRTVNDLHDSPPKLKKKKVKAITMAGPGKDSPLILNVEDTSEADVFKDKKSSKPASKSKKIVLKFPASISNPSTPAPNVGTFEQAGQVPLPQPTVTRSTPPPASDLLTSAPMVIPAPLSAPAQNPMPLEESKNLPVDVYEGEWQRRRLLHDEYYNKQSSQLLPQPTVDSTEDGLLSAAERPVLDTATPDGLATDGLGTGRNTPIGNGEAQTEGTGPSKKRKYTKKADDSTGATWRKGLKKGQTRADAIAMFREKNPGQPLPPGWEPPSGVQSSLTRSSSLRRDVAGTAAVSEKTAATVLAVKAEKVKPKGEEDWVGTVEVDWEDDSGIDIPQGPALPPATALTVDIEKIDHTDLEKLRVDVGVPLEETEALADPERLGHPVYRHWIDMEGIPVIKAVDPNKATNQKERDAWCPRDLKENIPGKSRTFVPRQMSLVGIGGSRLSFKAWTNAIAGPSSWRLERESRVAEQKRILEETMIASGIPLGPDGTPLHTPDMQVDENGMPTTIPVPTKTKPSKLTKSGKPRKQWTKKPVLDKPINPLTLGDLGQSEAASSPIPVPEREDVFALSMDISRQASPIPGESAAGDLGDIDADMENLL